MDEARGRGSRVAAEKKGAAGPRLAFDTSNSFSRRASRRDVRENTFRLRYDKGKQGELPKELDGQVGGQREAPLLVDDGLIRENQKG